MATADELLATLSGSEESKILLIDNDLRTINIPDSITSLGVEADDDVHRLYFQMPRMYGDTDLSTFNVRINYLNAKDEGDIYVVTDKNVLTSSITFSWLVGPHALLYKGDVKFIVCLKESDSDGNILREFNTTVATLPVLEGLEVDAAPLMGDLADVLEQLQSLTIAKVAEVAAAGAEQIAKVQEESSKQQDNIVNKGKEVLATIPEDYQTTYKLASEAVRTKADAIACEAEDRAIILHGTSDDCIRELKVFGKTTQATTTGCQLFDYADKYRSIGATVSNDTIEITLPSISPSNLELMMSCGELTAGTYYISAELGTAKYMRIEVFELFDDGTDLKIADSNLTAGNIKLPMTLESAKNIAVKIYTLMTKNDTVAGGSFKKPLVAIDENATWEPYTGGMPAPNPDYPLELESVENPTVNVYGKNLLVFNLEGSLTTNGITITDNGDGGILVTGTATAYVEFAIYGRYKDTSHGFGFDTTLSGGTSDSRLIAFRYKNGVYINAIDSQGSAVTVESSDGLCIAISVLESTTVNNVIYPMLTATATDNEFEKHKSIQSLTIPHTLPGIPVTTGGNYTDSDGQQWICDEIDFERGVYVQRCISATANSVFGMDSSGTLFKIYTNSALMTTYNASKNIMCNGYMGRDIDECKSAEYGICHYGKIVYIRNKDWLSEYDANNELAAKPVTFFVILESPIETPLTAEEIAAFKALKTNYPNTTILNDAGAWMSVKYNADTKSYVDNPKTLRLTDSSTGVVYELKIVDGAITVVPV